MIHLSMSAGRPPDLSAAEFDEYFRTRHLGLAKMLEGVRLLSATRVERSGGADGAAAAWMLDAWWDDADALTRCFRSYGGLALLGDRMTMMADPLPAVADVTEQVRHGSARDALLDPSVGPRAVTGTAKLHLLVPQSRVVDLDAVVDSLGPGWPRADDSGVGAYSVGRGTGAAYPLNNVLAGVDPPLLPSAPSRGSALELWLRAGAELDAVALALAPLRSLLDHPEVTWWYGASHNVFMSLPVASFLALDPVEESR